MNVHVIHRLRNLAFIALVQIASVPATIAASSAGLTPAETAQVKATADGMEQQCKIQAIAQLKEQAAKANNPAAPTWVARLTTGDYCTCIGQRVRAGTTPALLRSGTAADGQALVKNAANACAVDNFKATFPEICRSWSEGQAGPSSLMSSYIACFKESGIVRP
jgi:hypothetical protein